MRVTVELEVFGMTIAELANQADRAWAELTDDATAVLPSDAEFRIAQHGTGDEYRAVVFIRSKIESAVK